MLDAFLAMLRGEIPEPAVWTADITYWIAGRQQSGTAKPEWSTEEGFLRLHNELGILPYYYYEKFWAAEPQYDGADRTDRARRQVKSIAPFSHARGRTAGRERLFAVELLGGHHEAFRRVGERPGCFAVPPASIAA